MKLSLRGTAVAVVLTLGLAGPGCSVTDEARLSEDGANALAAVNAYVPLSAPAQLSAPQPLLALRIKPQLAGYLAKRGGGFKIAYKSTTSLTFLTPSEVDPSTGTLSLRDAGKGSYVVVSELLKNDLPVVTHWNSMLHGGRGGRELGATDAAAAVVTSTGGQYTATFFDMAPASPFTWNTGGTGLLSPGSGAAAEARVPQFESYVGENYSVYGFSEDYIVNFSNRVLAATGFPVVHLNAKEKCRAEDVQQGAPVFQIVHACTVGEGDKQSLATIVLPPNWTSARTSTYPILFYGYYDIHFTFVTYGETIVRSIGNVVNEGHGSAIGVLWNGGASFGTFGIQPSIYKNASLLFRQLGDGFAGDPEKIVAVGCSRGGSTALAVAGNPNERSYRVKEVVAYSPAVAYGMRDSEFTSPTYPGFISALGDLTGYKYAWREGWREEQTGYRAYERAFFNTFGTTDPAKVDEGSPISSSHLAAIKRTGTRIVLNVDTQDQFAPFGIFPIYANKARSVGVPLKLKINYRGTHCGNADMVTDGAEALARINANDEAFASTVEHYGITNPDQPSASIRFERIEPAAQPVFVEVPKYVVRGGTFLFSVSGAPETRFKLEVRKGDVAEPVLTFEGQLPALDPAALVRISTSTERRLWPADLPTGSDYFYTLSYSSDGSSWQSARYVPVVPREVPTRKASFKVLEREPFVDGNAFCTEVACRTSGWGLASR